MIILKLRVTVHCCKIFYTDGHVRQVTPMQVFKRLFRQVSVTNGKPVSTNVSIHLRQ